MEMAPPASPENDLENTDDVTLKDTDEEEGVPKMLTTPPFDPQLDVSNEQLDTTKDPCTSFSIDTAPPFPPEADDPENVDDVSVAATFAKLSIAIAPPCTALVDAVNVSEVMSSFEDWRLKYPPPPDPPALDCRNELKEMLVPATAEVWIAPPFPHAVD